MSALKTVPALLAISAVAGALFTGAALAPSFAGEKNPPAAAGRGWLSIPQVHEKLEAAGYRNIEKIERERGGYEARATDRSGERVKLYLDAQSGEVIERRARDRYRDERGPMRSRDGVDCSERRCRDDLPAAAKPAPVTATAPSAPTAK